MVLMNKKLVYIFLFFVCAKSLLSLRNPFFLQKKETTYNKTDKLQNIIFYGMGKSDKKICAFIEIDHQPQLVFLESNIFDFKIKEINKEYILLSNNKLEQKIFLTK